MLCRGNPRGCPKNFTCRLIFQCILLVAGKKNVLKGHLSLPIHKNVSSLICEELLHKLGNAGKKQHIVYIRTAKSLAKSQMSIPVYNPVKLSSSELLVKFHICLVK